MSEETDPQFISLFVFGTLRKNLGLHGYLEACGGYVDDKLWMLEGTANGEMFSYHGGFPVVVFDSECDDTVTGEVYLVDKDSPTFQNMHGMECGAGYTPTIVAITPTDPEEIPLRAMTYHWNRPTNFLDRVDHGDWKKYEEQFGTNAEMFKTRS